MSRSRLIAIAASSGAFALSATSAQGAWTLLDNFDSYDNSSSTATTDATGGVWDGEFEGTGNGNVIDAADGGGLDHSTSGQTLQTIGGAPWRGSHSDIESQFNAGLAVGDTATYFFQMKASGSGLHDIMTGLTDETSTIATGDAWQDFAVMPYVNGTPGSDLGYHMDDAGLSGNEIFSMSTDVWYNVWWVVDNDAETYSVYWSTGTDDGTLGGTASIYRNGFTGTDLNAMGFMAAGDADSQLQVDNIHFTSGTDTTFVPEPSVALLGALGGLALLRRRRA